MFRWLFGTIPKIGSEWRDRDCKNPFMNNGIVRILEIRGTWVRFHNIRNPPASDASMSIRGFREKYRRLGNG